MSLENRTLFTAELQLIMCIQNAHGCVFLQKHFSCVVLKTVVVLLAVLLKTIDD